MVEVNSVIEKSGALSFLFVISVFMSIYFIGCSGEEKEDSAAEASPELIIAAEDLNNVLPQRIALNTFFDSVSVSHNKMNYYYSLNHLSKEDYLQAELRDSLMTEAEDRVPCTLWRPAYMQGVEVSFTYFSDDGEEILQFTEAQTTCQ